MRVKVKVIEKEPVVILGPCDFCVLMYGRKFLEDFCDEEEIKELEERNYGGSAEDFRKRHIKEIKENDGNVFMLMERYDAIPGEFGRDQLKTQREDYYKLNIDDDIKIQKSFDVNVDVPEFISKIPIEESHGDGIIGEDVHIEKMTERQLRALRKGFEDIGGTKR